MAQTPLFEGGGEAKMLIYVISLLKRNTSQGDVLQLIISRSVFHLNISQNIFSYGSLKNEIVKFVRHISVAVIKSYKIYMIILKKSIINKHHKKFTSVQKFTSMGL